MQRVDDPVTVKNGAVVFCCDGTARASITASWYRQMGFPDVWAVAGGTAAWTAAGRALVPGADEAMEPIVAEACERARQIAPAELAAALASSRPPVVIHVETSDRFAAGRAPGARWLSRSWLELRIAELAPDLAAPIVVTDDEDRVEAALAAVTLGEIGYRDVAALRGGMEAWRREARPVEQGLTGVMRAPDDVVPAARPRRRSRPS